VSRGNWKLLSLVLDAVVVNAAVLLAFVVRIGLPLPANNLAALRLTLVPLTLIQLLILFLVGLYDPEAERSGPELFATVVKGAFIGVLVLTSLSFLLRAFGFPRTVLVLVFAFDVLLLYGWRRLASGVLHVHWPERRVVLVGSRADAAALLERMRGLEEWGYNVVGVICETAEIGDETGDGNPGTAPDDVALGAGSLGRGGRAVPAAGRTPEWIIGTDRLTAHIERLAPDQVIVATPSRHREILEEITLSPTFEGEIFVIPQLYEIHLGEVSFSLLGDVPLLRLTRPAWQQGVKGVVERVLSVVLLVVLSPLLVLVALAIVVFSGLPVFYHQERLGKGLRPFTAHKFRTMIKDAETAGAQFATVDDPRVTGIGRLLRSARIDELPQLLNVARGDMSLVGPRPERPEFVHRFIEEDPLYVERYRVRPGITGLAQVSAHYATTADVKLRFDLMYVYHQSLALDVRILLRTVQVVLTGKGAV
jgi:lipopolysaccharide/colanic/teichoic acid biosynthesis glycosyltransferase